MKTAMRTAMESRAEAREARKGRARRRGLWSRAGLVAAVALGLTPGVARALCWNFQILPLLPPPAPETTTTLDDGAGCHYSHNVITDDTYADTNVSIQNQDCVGGAGAACEDPQNATAICVESGGFLALDLQPWSPCGSGLQIAVAGQVDVRDVSSLTMEDGRVGYVAAWNAATVRIRGGDAVGLTGYDRSTLEVSGGRVIMPALGDESTLLVTGGFFLGDVVLADDARAMVGGGTLRDGIDGTSPSIVRLQGRSSVEITGGFLGIVAAGDEARATIRGGALGDSLIVTDGGVITVSGSAFALDGQAVRSRWLAPGAGRLTGVLDDGSPIDVAISSGPECFGSEDPGCATGRVQLVPEPRGPALGLGAGCTLLALRRRRERLPARA